MILVIPLSALLSLGSWKLKCTQDLSTGETYLMPVTACKRMAKINTQRKSCAKILLTFDSSQQALRTQAIYEYSGDQLQDSNIPMAEGEILEVVEEDTDGYGVN